MRIAPAYLYRLAQVEVAYAPLTVRSMVRTERKLPATPRPVIQARASSFADEFEAGLQLPHRPFCFP